MKKETIIIIWLAIAYLTFQNLLKIPYIMRVFSDDFYLRGNIRQMLTVICFFIYIITDLITLVVGAVAVVGSNTIQKEKAYTWFRYIFVVMGILYIVLDVYYFYLSGRYFFHELWRGIVRLFMFASLITLVYFLIKNKPTRAVPKVNLQDYDLVAYTSNSHRFVHYLLDVLFMIPLSLNIVQIFSHGDMFYWMGYKSEVLMELFVQLIIGIAFIFYYFISEAIFGQTFGKMVTKSCVVTNGVEYSNGRMLRRALCRLIPFDKISFLVGGNWHDKVSDTSVVYVDSWENSFKDTANNDQA